MKQGVQEKCRGEEKKKQCLAEKKEEEEQLKAKREMRITCDIAVTTTISPPTDSETNNEKHDLGLEDCNLNKALFVLSMADELIGHGKETCNPSNKEAKLYTASLWQ